MDSNTIYTALLPHCKPGYERTLRVYVQFCIDFCRDDDASLCENHHIIPKSLEPQYTNLNDYHWNKARLTFRDHFRAHKMLARCIGGSMMYALWRMANSHSDAGYLASLQEYERARHQFIRDRKGYQHSDKTRQKMSVSRKGLSPSADTRQKISNSQKGISKHSEETCQRMSNNRKGKQGRPQSAETKRKISESKLGKSRSDETRQKLSESHKGNRHSEETRRKMSNSRKGQPRSEETIRKMIETRKQKPKVTCPHCNKTGSAGGMKRYHFDNCKSKP